MQKELCEAAVEIEIDVQASCDALALSELLVAFHSFLVQHDHEHWIVHARTPGCHGETLPEAVAVIAAWRSGRDLPEAACRVSGRTYHLPRARVA